MKLSEKELVSIIRAYRTDSLGSEDGELSVERAAAMDHYHGRPYGDEQEGRSQVVSKDLSETVDWIMPTVMRTFLQSGNLAEFVPVGPEDEELAKQASDYTNHVILKDNNGFLVLHDAVKDALLLKNGYVKHYVEEKQKVREVSYEGLSEDELTKLLYDLDKPENEVKIKGHEAREVTVGMDEAGPQSIIVHDITLTVVEKKKAVCIEAVPPEEVRVSKRCRGSLQDSPFTEHVTRKTRSDLIEMGMPRDFVDELPAYTGDDATYSEVRARNTLADESDGMDSVPYDRSMDEIEYCEAYIRVDYDGDGVAELRKVVTVADRIPPGEDWNEPIDSVPMTSIQAKRVPHRHVGESLDDELADLQRIKTTLMRQMLDNIYFTNNTSYVVNDRVHLPDFLKPLPGGIKRVMDADPVDGSFAAVPVPPILDKILPAIDWVDSVKENRTGISRSMTQMDPDLLKATTKGAFLESLNQASQKVEMIIRMLAETGVRELVLRVHELLIKHQDKPRLIKLRGNYVEINPCEWRERTDLTVKVGLGTGTGEEQREKLMLLATLQEKLAAYGMIGPSQAHAMFVDIAEALGVSNPEQYILDPRSPEYQQMNSQEEQQNPLAEVEAIKGQFKLQAQQIDLQYRAQLDQLKMQVEQEKQMLEAKHKAEIELLKQSIQVQNKAAERASREAIEAAKLEVRAFLEGMKVDLGKPGIGAGLHDGN